MKKCILILFFVSSLAYTQELRISTIRDYGPFYSTGNLHAVIYFIPYHILTRYPYNVEDVKRAYHLKIEIREVSEISGFLERIENTSYVMADNGSLDLRNVVEIIYNNETIFSFSLSGGNVIIDGNEYTDGIVFRDFYSQYLPLNHSN